MRPKWIKENYSFPLYKRDSLSYEAAIIAIKQAIAQDQKEREEYVEELLTECGAYCIGRWKQEDRVMLTKIVAQCLVLDRNKRIYKVATQIYQKIFLKDDSQFPLSEKALESLLRSGYSKTQVENWQGSIKRCSGKVHSGDDQSQCLNDRKAYHIIEKKTGISWGTCWKCSVCSEQFIRLISDSFDIIPMEET